MSTPRHRHPARPAVARLAAAMAPLAVACALLPATVVADDRAPGDAPLGRPAPAATAPDAPAARSGPAEPQVRHVVVEDDGVRVEELRVRGVTRHIRVQPKTPGSAPYQILPPDASQPLDDGTAASRGARGQRVWNVLAF